MSKNKQRHMPIYLVSLEKDTAKRAELKHKFPKYYDSFINLGGVDGAKLMAKEYYDNTIDCLKKHKIHMTPGELGCTLSHLKVLEYFVDSGEEYALILEDDVIGTDEDIEKIRGIIQKLDKNSLFLCGGQEGIIGRKFQYGKKTGIDKNVFEVCRFSYAYIYRTCCYVVTPKSANKILDYHKKCLMIADIWGKIFKQSNIKLYYANILSHPEDLINSNLEFDRSPRKETFWGKIFSINILAKIYRRLYTEIYCKLLKLKGYKKF